MSKYIIEVPDDMEYALLTGQTKTGYWSQAIEFSELEKAEPHWIPVTERLPEIGKEVLFCDLDGDCYVGHRSIEYWFGECDKVKNVRAWMPLPEPFKEVTE